MSKGEIAAECCDSKVEVNEGQIVEEAMDKSHGVMNFTIDHLLGIRDNKPKKIISEDLGAAKLFSSLVSMKLSKKKQEEEQEPEPSIDSQDED